MEEGEVVEEEEQEPHPLVSITKIDPDEIPEVPSNRFLYRADAKKSSEIENTDRRRQRIPRIRGHTRSGRVIKGRGTFRYRTPSRSRSRSYTPPHWKRELSRTIKLSEYEQKEQEKKKREEEIKRREEERKKRHMERDKKMQEYMEKRVREREERRENQGEKRRFREEPPPNYRNRQERFRNRSRSYDDKTKVDRNKKVSGKEKENEKNFGKKNKKESQSQTKEEKKMNKKLSQTYEEQRKIEAEKKEKDKENINFETSTTCDSEKGNYQEDFNKNDEINTNLENIEELEHNADEMHSFQIFGNEACNQDKEMVLQSSKIESPKKVACEKENLRDVESHNNNFFMEKKINQGNSITFSQNSSKIKDIWSEETAEEFGERKCGDEDIWASLEEGIGHYGGSEDIEAKDAADILKSIEKRKAHTKILLQQLKEKRGVSEELDSSSRDKKIKHSEKLDRSENKDLEQSGENEKNKIMSDFNRNDEDNSFLDLKKKAEKLEKLPKKENESNENPKKANNKEGDKLDRKDREKTRRSDSQRDYKKKHKKRQRSRSNSYSDRSNSRRRNRSRSLSRSRNRKSKYDSRKKR